jgi:hypothetical protein
MKLARKDAEAKNGAKPFLKPGNGRGGAIGQEIREASEQAKAELGRRLEIKARSDALYTKLSSGLMRLPWGKSWISQTPSCRRQIICSAHETFWSLKITTP